MNNGTEVACVYPNLSKPPRPVDCWRFPAGVVTMPAADSNEAGAPLAGA